jgi:hypothetical protein
VTGIVIGVVAIHTGTFTISQLAFDSTISSELLCLLVIGLVHIRFMMDEVFGLEVGVYVAQAIDICAKLS